MISIRKADTEEDIAAAVAIQLQVFCAEQGISEAECQEGNADSVHLLALDGTAIVATARLRLQEAGEAEVARVAVLPEYRSAGLGKRLVAEIEPLARELEVRQLVLHPHAYLEDFYTVLGYARTDDAAYNVGEHAIITMRKRIGDAGS